jgi:S1-C subfamily serine protease
MSISMLPHPRPALALRLAGSLLLAGAGAAQGQAFNPATLEPAVVRIEVHGAGGAKAASGFLWQQPNQVVTSLHAVPGDAKIVVECRGVKSIARVIKVLQRADLALLQTEAALSGCRAFTAADEQAPAPNSDLHTFGYHAGAKSGTSRRLNKGYSQNETLENLVAGPALQSLRSFGMPAVDLKVYYVEGGLLPGYSGAPVVNAGGRLIGVVDGGLNDGQSNYNWVIPARHLTDLLASKDTDVPSQVAKSSAQHFSAGIATADASTQIGFEVKGQRYRFVKTKTQSLAALAASSSDPNGVRHLLQLYGATVGNEAVQAMRFDVYEDVDQGLIISVPVGQTPRLEEPQPGYQWFIAEAGSGPGAGYDGHVQFEVMNRQSLLRLNAPVLQPSDPRYFDEVAAALLEDCRDGGKKRCAIDMPTRRRVDLGAGNVIMKIGVITEASADQAAHYDYYTFAARGDNVFRSNARFHWSGNGGLIGCTARPGTADCADKSKASTHLAQLVATHMTSFAIGPTR